MRSRLADEPHPVDFGLSQSAHRRQRGDLVERRISLRVHQFHHTLQRQTSNPILLAQVRGVHLRHSRLHDFQQVLEEFLLGDDAVGGRFGHVEVLVDPKFALASPVEANIGLIEEVEADLVLPQDPVALQHALEDVESFLVRNRAQIAEAIGNILDHH